MTNWRNWINDDVDCLNPKCGEPVSVDSIEAQTLSENDVIVVRCDPCLHCGFTTVQEWVMEIRYSLQASEDASNEQWREAGGEDERWMAQTYRGVEVFDFTKEEVE